MSDLFGLAILAAITLALGLTIAAIAEYRRKDLITQLKDEAERAVHYGDPCPWDLR